MAEGAKVSQLAAAFEGGQAQPNEYGAGQARSNIHRSSPSSPKVPTFLAFVKGQEGSDTKDIDVSKMERIRSSGGDADSYVYDGNAGGDTVKAARPTTLTPGSHPWINLSGEGRSVSRPETKKKIVIPPPSAW